jgi:hypothetical protein
VSENTKRWALAWQATWARVYWTGTRWDGDVYQAATWPTREEAEQHEPPRAIAREYVTAVELTESGTEVVQ